MDVNESPQMAAAFLAPRNRQHWHTPVRYVLGVDRRFQLWDKQPSWYGRIMSETFWCEYESELMPLLVQLVN